jgi:hypothetical protein
MASADFEPAMISIADANQLSGRPDLNARIPRRTWCDTDCLDQCHDGDDQQRLHDLLPRLVAVFGTTSALWNCDGSRKVHREAIAKLGWPRISDLRSESAVEHRGIRFVLLTTIVRRQWRVAVYIKENDAVERTVKGSRLNAEAAARAMIDRLLGMPERVAGEPNKQS